MKFSQISFNKWLNFNNSDNHLGYIYALELQTIY